MANTVRVDVVSAEEEIFSGDAEFIAVPASAGEVGIYPHHAPMITTIKPGALRIKLPDTAEETLIFLSGGLLEVQPGLVTILADEAKAIAALEAAEEAMKNRESDMDYAKAAAELAEAAAQIQAIKKLRKA